MNSKIEDVSCVEFFENAVICASPEQRTNFEAWWSASSRHAVETCWSKRWAMYSRRFKGLLGRVDHGRIGSLEAIELNKPGRVLFRLANSCGQSFYPAGLPVTLPGSTFKRKARRNVSAGGRKPQLGAG